ncbi:MAG: 4-hydroxy-3-methylbut-2-enyl diphosphate reductase [Gammaproteobacteria bacterium]|nr:4-hydroxy-3-methylbut-2-enyl diphosphate reductase [Gammaproteobacteria bacterium]
MDVLLANPRGFCAGVDRAIAVVERAIEMFGAPIYVRHEVVHNKFVVDGLREKGAIFVEQLSEIPNNATVIFSAHGVPKKTWIKAEKRGLRVFDATCPLVTKVHLEVAKHASQGHSVVLIGHAGHPEVEGTLGQYGKNKEGGAIYLVETIDQVNKLNIKQDVALAFVTQTTLSVDDTITIIDALKKRFPHITGPRRDDICYATQNRQDAVKVLAETCDLVLVVGSVNSSNSNRLREIAEKYKIEAYLIDNADEISRDWLKGKQRVGVTAGASAPEVLVQEVITLLKSEGAQVKELQGREEKVSFSLPKSLLAESVK